MTLRKRLTAGLLAMVMAFGAIPASRISAEEAIPRPYAEIDYTKDGLYQLEGSYTIYVNGKDQKQNGVFYKTCSFQFAGRTLGAKKNVAVIPAVTFCDYDYDQMFTNGKLRSDIARAGKQYASARIDQNGKVTVTAGKKAGQVYIFVYEVIDKKLVHDGDGGIGEKFGVNPLNTEVVVASSHSAILYTTDKSKLIWATETAEVDKEGKVITTQSPILKKSDQTVSLSVGETATLYLADKKAIPSDISCHRDNYPRIFADSFDGTIVSVDGYSGTGEVEASWDSIGDEAPENTDRNVFCFELKGMRAGKTTIIITDPISGKTAKVKVVVK